MTILKKTSLRIKDFSKIPGGYLGHSTASTAVDWVIYREPSIASGKAIEAHAMVVKADALSVSGRHRPGQFSSLHEVVSHAAGLVLEAKRHGRDTLTTHVPYSVTRRHAKKGGEVMVVLLKESPEQPPVPHNPWAHAESFRFAAQFAEVVLARLKELTPVQLSRAVESIEEVSGADHVAMVDALLLSAAESLNSSKRKTADEQGETADPTKAVAADPLQAARDRGKHQAVVEWEKPDNLTLKAAAEYAGRSDRVLNEERLKGRLYALVLPGKARGFRYPQWQFDAEPERVAAVLAPFNHASASCWVIHNFLHRPHETLGGVAPRERILDSTYPIDRIVQIVAERYRGDQGAG